MGCHFDKRKDLQLLAFLRKLAFIEIQILQRSNVLTRTKPYTNRAGRAITQICIFLLRYKTSFSSDKVKPPAPSHLYCITPIGIPCTVKNHISQLSTIILIAKYIFSDCTIDKFLYFLSKFLFQ